MIQLSVVIITFNEEKNIGRCLDSVKEIADDIVVIDSFSTDKTEEICKSKGARFVSHKFDGHIEQKNFAVTQAKFPHILSLDADEALSDELKKNILAVKNNWTNDGYYMNRLTNYCGQWIHHCGWYPDRKLRLWDSRKGKWGGMNPHDKFEMNEKNKVGFLQGDILHYSYYSIDEHYKQAEKFAEISAREMKKQGRKISVSMIYLKTGFKFLRNYFFKLGFLDGKYGFVICKITAWETYLKYRNLYDSH
ncbi:MAG: glycosyltransferase family 2 protein [Bacteroidetes bacterium]|nr:glycosyltransferase family 2 protein [Bacteroidota bacterium]